jgi:aminoglycoside phosphotransferase (APT) family kinase protein
MPTRQQVDAVIARHRLDVHGDDTRPLPGIGTVNRAVALGQRYVLRIPKPSGAAETRTESVAAPAAKAAGLATPALLVYDDDCDIFKVPYTVYERVEGENFGLFDLESGASAQIYRSIGRQLATLHQVVQHCPDPRGYLARPLRADPEDLLEHLGSEAFLGRLNIAWLGRVIARLRPAVAEAAPHRRFLHNDLLATNILVREGKLAAIIDWNAAGWGDPALEFWAFPSRIFPCVLEGYQQVARIDGAETLPERILWDHLCLALESVLAPTEKGNLSWGTPPFARLIEILAMAAQYQPWQLLLGP